MDGFGPRLIPGEVHQAAVARGVRLSLAEKCAFSWHRLWVSGQL